MPGVCKCKQTTWQVVANALCAFEKVANINKPLRLRYCTILAISATGSVPAILITWSCV
jgi:hypothetical protein